MVEPIIKYSKRAIFPKGKQAEFLLQAKERMNLSWTLLAEKINIHSRTLNDWKREEYSISVNHLEKICRISELSFPSGIKIKSPFWYVYKGARKGGLSSIKKYGSVGGDPEYRKQRWYQWWNAKGKYLENGYITAPLKIKIPRFSRALAEFTGIMLGDGGISRGQVIVSTNSIDDKLYGFFVKELMKNLFNVEPAIYYPLNASVMNIVVSRKNLVEFCNSKLGLKIGNKLKQGLDIPDWIKGNVEFEKACMRGLMDTDGCLFYECHNIKNKRYCYPRLAFVTASMPLRDSVVQILNKLNLNPKIRNKNKRYVQIEDKEKIKDYFKIIGSSNPKHLNKYYYSGNMNEERAHSG